MTSRRERILQVLILASLGVALAVRADQPIVENYVGRQIPTAMVARNLDRGSGFWQPTLDTAPFPNRFLVEPPIYAQAVVWAKEGIRFAWEEIGDVRVGVVWEPPGRWTSAAMTVLGAWAFCGLVRRREGPGVALIALAAFAVFPVTLRYGRAFQPDAMMLGFVLLGLRAWDEYEATGRRSFAALGAAGLGLGLTIKVTAGWALIPYMLLVRRLPTRPRAAVGVALLAPAVGWYLFAWNELRHGSAGGSLAPGDTAATWAGSIGPATWGRLATWDAIARNLLARAFTPLGFVLASLGWGLAAVRRERVDRLWLGWGGGCALAVLALAAKWHHGYYWLAVAPVAAVGVARGLAAIARAGEPRLGRPLAAGLGAVLVGLAALQAAPTWRDPPEWRTVRDLPDLLPTPLPNWLVIAPEAALYYIDRPGFRLEFSPEAARRASGEWDPPLAPEPLRRDPLALVDFYLKEQAAGALDHPGALVHQVAAARSDRIMVVDVGPVEPGSAKAAWRTALLRRPGARVWRNRPELVMVEVGDPSCRTALVAPPDDAPLDIQPLPVAAPLP